MFFCLFFKNQSFFSSGGSSLTFTARHCCMNRGNTATPILLICVVAFICFTLENTRYHGFTLPHSTLKKTPT